MYDSTTPEHLPVFVCEFGGNKALFQSIILHNNSNPQFFALYMTVRIVRRAVVEVPSLLLYL